MVCDSAEREREREREGGREREREREREGERERGREGERERERAPGAVPRSSPLPRAAAAAEAASSESANGTDAGMSAVPGPPAIGGQRLGARVSAAAPVPQRRQTGHNMLHGQTWAYAETST